MRGKIMTLGDAHPPASLDRDSMHSGPTTLADRVAAARHRRFVGRDAELALFRDALACPDPPFAVLFVHGPGGIGKTTLLGEFRRLAELDGRPVVAVDGRACEPSPPGFLAAIARELGIEEPSRGIEHLAARDGTVLLIDTSEMLAPLDGWLRNDFLPRLPASAITVLGGRIPPDRAWRASDGWADLVEVLPLRNLDPAASRTYLACRHIPADARDSVVAFTHGHPLALSLVGDVAARSGVPFAPDREPDVVAALLEHFIEHEPSPRHRQALEACATARVTTETLLARLFGENDAHELFQWLRGLSFIEHDRDGVFPHDLARDVLVSNLRWRHPARFVETHRQVHDHIVTRIRATHGREQHQELYSLMFLHRNNPTWQRFAPTGQSAVEYLDRATDDDASLIIETIQQHEGVRSAEIAARWLDLQPEGFTLLRDVHAEISGLMLALALEGYDREDVAFDPLAVAVLDMIERHGPLRPGDAVRLARYCMGTAQYRTPTLRLGFSMIGAGMMYALPNLAWMLTPVIDPEYWESIFDYIHMHRIPDADVTIGDTTWRMFGHDWRRETVTALDRILVEREMSRTSVATSREPIAAPALMVLSKTEFRQAVRQALRDFHHASALAANPLSHSRLVQEGGKEPVAALRSLIAGAAAAFDGAARLRTRHDALRLTWLEPAGTQEAVAELLGVPFSTYRRHLEAAVDLVADELWRRELALGSFRSG